MQRFFIKMLFVVVVFKHWTKNCFKIIFKMAIKSKMADNSNSQIWVCALQLTFYQVGFLLWEAIWDPKLGKRLHALYHLTVFPSGTRMVKFIVTHFKSNILAIFHSCHQKRWINVPQTYEHFRWVYFIFLLKCKWCCCGSLYNTTNFIVNYNSWDAPC